MTNSRTFPELLAATSWPPTLRAAIQAVFELHTEPDQSGACIECVGARDYPIPYPCPTVAAIIEALEKTA